MFTGLRPWDKLSEEFLYSDETATPTDIPEFATPLFTARGFGDFELKMNSARGKGTSSRVASTLELFGALVPQYRPTETMIRISQGFPPKMKRKIAVVTSSRADYSHCTGRSRTFPPKMIST